MKAPGGEPSHFGGDSRPRACWAEGHQQGTSGCRRGGARAGWGDCGSLIRRVCLKPVVGLKTFFLEEKDGEVWEAFAASALHWEGLGGSGGWSQERDLEGGGGGWGMMGA